MHRTRHHRAILMLSLILLGFAHAAHAAALFYEPFDYADGALLRNQGTYAYSGSAPTSRITNDNLAVEGLVPPQGKMLRQGTAGTAATVVYTNWGQQYGITAGQSSYDVYASLYLRVNTPLGNDYSNLFSIGISQYNGIMLRQHEGDSNRFDIGLTRRMSPSPLDAVWSDNGGVGYAQNTVYLLVLCNELATTGTSIPGGLRLWINPPTWSYGTRAPLHATLTTAGSNFAADRYSRAYFHANVTDADVLMDEVRCGTNWADVTPPAPDEIIQPVNLSPADGALASLTPTLTASPFASTSASTHIATEFSLYSLLSAAAWSFSAGPVTSYNMPAAMLTPDSLYAWQVRYIANNGTSRWSGETVFQTASTGAAVLIAYDGAAYATTNTIAGLAGGFGWNAAWQMLRQGANGVGATADGLTYDTLVVTGGAFVTADTTTNILRAARQLAVRDGVAHLLTPALKYGKPGSTNWLSCLMACGPDLTNGEYGVELYDGTVRRVFVVKAIDRARWWIGAFGTNGAGAAAELFTNTTQWLVLRLINSAADASNGVLQLWINPPLDITPPGTDTVAVTVETLRPFEYERLAVYANTWQTNGMVIPPAAHIDEVRLGDDWRTMVDVPEPAALLLALLLAWRARQARAGGTR